MSYDQTNFDYSNYAIMPLILKPLLKSNWLL